MKTITKYVGDSGKEYTDKTDALLDDCREYADNIARLFDARGNDFTEADYRIFRAVFEGMARHPRKAYRRLLRLRSLVQQSAQTKPLDDIPF